MTVEQIQAGAGEVRLRLGRVPIQLPGPVATLARTVVSNHKGHATIAALVLSPWLFPGGQPGRPISGARPTHRLNNLGIRPNQARSTALFRLATEIPQRSSPRTLGIHIDVAVIWQRRSAGDWATYAIEINHRTSRPMPPISADVQRQEISEVNERAHPQRSAHRILPRSTSSGQKARTPIGLNEGTDR